MRRMLLAKPEHDREVIEAWGLKIDSEKAIGSNKTQAELLDEVADEHPEWFAINGFGDPDKVVEELSKDIKILKIKPKDEDEQNP